MSGLPDMQPVIDSIHAAKRCLVTSHIDPEGDSLGSQLVLGEMLRELGKEVALVDADTPPAKFGFMPGIDTIISPEGIEAEVFDTAFVVDCGSLDRIGNVASLVEGRHVVNIDHHRSNTRFGHINYVVPDACATGYLLYQLNERLGLPLSLPKASNIYTAIITDTGNFQFSNTSAGVLSAAAELVASGVDPALLSRHVFGFKPMPALKLLGEGLVSLHTVADGRVGVIALHRSVFERVGATEADAEGVVNFANRVKGTAAGVLLRETESGDIKVSFRSDGEVDVDAVAKQFGGGGHRNAAGARLPGPLDEACRLVVEAFNGALPPADV